MSFEKYLQKTYFKHALDLSQVEADSTRKHVEYQSTVKKVLDQLEKTSPRIHTMLQDNSPRNTHFIAPREVTTHLHTRSPSEKLTTKGLNNTIFRLPELVSKKAGQKFVKMRWDESSILRTEGDNAWKTERILGRSGNITYKPLPNVQFTTHLATSETTRPEKKEKVARSVQKHFRKIFEANAPIKPDIQNQDWKQQGIKLGHLRQNSNSHAHTQRHFRQASNPGQLNKFF